MTATPASASRADAQVECVAAGSFGYEVRMRLSPKPLGTLVAVYLYQRVGNSWYYQNTYDYARASAYGWVDSTGQTTNKLSVYAQHNGDFYLAVHFWNASNTSLATFRQGRGLRRARK